MWATHSVVDPKEGRAKISQNVVCADKTVLAWEDVNAFAKRSDVTGPDGAGIVVNGEVEARLTDAVSRGGDDK